MEVRGQGRGSEGRVGGSEGVEKGRVCEDGLELLRARWESQLGFGDLVWGLGEAGI